MAIQNTSGFRIKSAQLNKRNNQGCATASKSELVLTLRGVYLFTVQLKFSQMARLKTVVVARFDETPARTLRTREDHSVRVP